MTMFTRPKRPTHTIDMAPLIDVVFLLLIFFMLTSNFVPPSLPLKLPQASSAAVTPGEAVVVSLDAEGVVAIAGTPVTLENFETALKEALKVAGTTTVHFRGDRTAGYGDFVQLMDAARRAGAGQFNLLHEPAAKAP
jgi:biopolymer transport protein ExbD